MPLKCPACGATRLRVAESMELGPDDRSDEVTLQIVRCGGCDLASVAVYEESRRGPLGEESVSHCAFPTDAEALEEVMAIFASCRRPRDADCTCRGHRRARQMVRRRSGPAGVRRDSPMPIVFVR